MGIERELTRGKSATYDEEHDKSASFHGNGNRLPSKRIKERRPPFIPFGNGNFPKPLTGVLCARWQRDGKRASLSRCGRGTTGHVFVLGSPPTDVSKPRRQRRALSRTRGGSFIRSFSFRNRCNFTRSLLEFCGNFNLVGL